MTCNTTQGSGYSVDVCLDAPLDGTTVSGDTTVTASVSVNGSSPGISKLRFYLDSVELLTDYEAPYEFILPTDTFVDGTVLFEVEAFMRDSLVTSRTAITFTFSNGVSTTPSAPTDFTPRLGTTPGPGQPFVVAATGDGASGQTSSDNVASTIGTIDPNLVLYLGDVYDEGTYTEFKNWYGEGTRFGTFASITNPTIGNHERSGDTWDGYDYYWGTPDPWFSFDSNGWHFINLNLSRSSDGSNSAQLTWLANDLASSGAECQIAFFHLPVLSVGPQGDNPEFNLIWEMLVDDGVDIVLTGHDHSYQRWHALDRNLAIDSGGTTQFVVGSGGHGIQNFVRTDMRLAEGFGTVPAAYGALELELNSGGAAFSYVDTSASVIDSGSIGCGAADITPPTVPTNVATSATSHTQIDVGWSASSDDVGVTGYSIYRDGSLAGTVGGSKLSYSDGGLEPSTTYSYRVEALDAAGNQSGQSTPPVSGTTLSPPASFIVTSEADSWVDGSATSSNFGSSTQMRVDATPDRRAYVRFDVSGITDPVISVTLRVNAASTHSGGFVANEVADDTWGEFSINYANAPTVGSALGSSGPTSAGTYATVDVTQYVTANGDYSFALTPTNGTNLRLSPRETATPPELVIVQDVSGNSPPTADDVSIATDEDQVGTWTPSVSDPDPNPLTCSITAQPGNGSATVASDCSLATYTPDPDFNGADSFTYEVSDGIATDPGNVSVTVNPTNDAPTADASATSTTQGTAVTIQLSGSDPDGDCPLTFALASAPANGSLGAISNEQCSGGVATADVVYSPDSGYTGTDSFTFTVEDPSTAQSAPAMIDITIDVVQASITLNPAADSYVDGSATGSNFGSSTQMRVDASPDRRGYVRFDVTGISGTVTSATLRVRANSTHSAGYEVQEVTDSGWDEAAITFANAPSFGPVLGASGPTTSGAYSEIDVTGYVSGNGQHSFAVTTLSNTNLPLSTREAANQPELVIQQDISGNNPPTADDVSLVTPEDQVDNWTPVVSDPDSDPLTCSIATQPASGSATVATDCSTATYTPDPNYHGDDSLTYQVSDGPASDQATVSVTVDPVNDDPVADGRSITVIQDTPTSVAITGSDTDGDCPLTFAVASSPTNGALGTVSNVQCASGAASADITYTPDPGYTGPDSFSFTVEDPSTGISSAATVSVTVDPPQTSFAFNPVADSYVDGNAPGNNYGSSTQIRIDGSPDRRGYLRFDVSGLPGPVVSATLRVYASSTHSFGYEAQAVADNSWSEGAITYSTAPSFGPVVGASGPTTGGSYTEVDVTASVTGDGLYSFALTPLSNTNLRLSPREAANQPELVILVGP